MYRKPENNQKVKRFWTALEVGFFSMQITYPITYFPSNWNILTFFTTFRFVSFHFIWFCASWVLSWEFTLSKGKKLWGNVVFTTTTIHIYFASLTLICELLFIHRILLETKMSILNSQMIPYLGVSFLFWLSRFYKLSFRLFIPTFQWGKVLRNAATYQSHATCFDRITWSFWYLLFFYCLQNNNDVSPISTYK